MAAKNPTPEPAKQTAAKPAAKKSTKATTPAERRARAQALRNAQIRRERRRRLLIGGAVVVVVAGLVTGGVVLATSRSSNKSSVASGDQLVPAQITTANGDATVQKAAVTVTNESGIDGVVAYDTSGYPGTTGNAADAIEHQHVTGPVTYSVTPPVGGPHNAVWMNAGVYTVPVPTERAVHNLEHGAIWISYTPSLPVAQIAALTAFVGRQSLIDESQATQISGQENRYMDLTPWADDSLASPIVVSAWGYQLAVDSPTDPRLQKFVDTFRHNAKYSPEFGAAVDGVPVQTGGRAAQFGATKANPAGSAANG